MKQSYYLYKSGRLQRKDNTLEIVYKDNTKKSIPVERVDDIYVMTEFDFNTSLLNFLSQFGINIHFFNYYGFYTGTYYPKELLVSGKLLIKQVEHYNDKEKRLNIAKAFIEAASYNIYRNLTYYNNRGKDLKDYMKEIDFLRKQIKLCKDVPELMGIEGNIRKVYYDSWNIIINQDIAFEKRVKNPPDNAINSLISYVNTIIYTRVLSEIYKTQLNPTISYLHEPSERRFSLCLDIAEIFKPIIADRLIFSMLNKRQITEKDFEEGLNFTYIKDEARKNITREIDLRLQTKIKHKKLDREVSYEYLMRLEVYKLIKHLLEDEEYEGFKMWWYMYVILVYDINLENKEGQRVLRNVFKTCKKYLVHIQNSVFEGKLLDSQAIKLKSELDRYIREDKDSVILFKSRSSRWLEKEFLGKIEDDKTDNFL